MSKFLRYQKNNYSAINEFESKKLLNIKQCDYLVWAVRKITWIESLKNLLRKTKHGRLVIISNCVICSKKNLDY